METPQIRVKTEGFRAIAKSDIIIDGITVVAGENGCGKSTLSKLLYYLYKTASNYDALVAKELQRNLRDVIRFLDIAQHELPPFINKETRKKELYKDLEELRHHLTIDEEQMGKWLELIRKTGESYSILFSDLKNSKLINPRIKRLISIIKDILNEKTDDTDENSSLPFDKISQFVESRFKEAMGKVKSRPTSLFIEELKNVFSEGKLPKIFEVIEYGEKIVSLDKDNLSIPYSVQNVIYVETPLMIGIENSGNQYWNDLNLLLQKKGKSSFSDLSLIINEIISGEVSLNEDTLSSNDFVYKRKDGEKFDLLDCATGIKSFGIIQLLLNNGSLNDKNKTLLIIDEPESNLHPQWIIEYARLIVLLNKEIGMKFFIASHNPDMVSAIKYIAEKQKVDKNLNFYLAEKTKKKFQYNYKHLGTDIEPIFGSFNIAIERINKYGS